jgi:hypothetical protein
MSANLLSGVWANPGAQPVLSPHDWEALLGQARQARLQGRLAQHFRDHGWLERVPQRPRHHLEGALRLVERQRSEVEFEVDQIRRALAASATPIVLLKGAAYLMAGLPPSRGRLFSDIDFMVPKASLAMTEASLFAAGWLSEDRDAYTGRYYRDWMHEIPPMKHVHRGTTVDVHHTISPPTSRFAVDGAKLLARAQPIPQWPGLLMLAPADMVLHCATHLFQEGDFGHGLRDLLDLNDLITGFGGRPAFWPELLERAEELHLEIPLSHGLIQLGRLFSTGPPEAMGQRIANLDRRPARRWLMTALLGIALRPEHPSCDGPLTAAVRWALYVRSHYLRMPIHQIAPHLIRKAYMRRRGARVETRI